MCLCGRCSRQCCQAEKSCDKMGDAADLVSATHELEEANMEGAADESRFVTVAVVT